MNPDDRDMADLEDLLRGLPLRRPSAALDAHVLNTHESPHGRRPQPWRQWPIAGAIGAAVALAAAVVIAMTWSLLLADRQDDVAPQPAAVAQSAPDSPTSPGQPVFEPVRIERQWATYQPQGVIVVDNRTAVRGLRR